MDDIRRDIIRRVEARRRAVQLAAYRKGQEKAAAAPAWRRWLAGKSGDDAQTDLDSFAVELGEESQPHVVLPEVSSDTANAFGKHLDDLPGLSLQPSTARSYPQRETACHMARPSVARDTGGRRRRYRDR